MASDARSIQLNGIHHVAYRCIDAKQTVEFYQRHLDMEFILAIAEDQVPSTGENDPYMHVFLDAGHGNVLAFFELPESPAMGRDSNTPEWVQHIAFELKSLDALMAAKTRLDQAGIKVIGPTDHTIFKSLYFFDPNGHRIELAANTAQAGMLEELKRIAPLMLDEWSKTKKAPHYAQWMHGKSKFEVHEKEADFLRGY